MGTTLKHPQCTGLILREGFESARAKSFAGANDCIYEGSVEHKN